MKKSITSETDKLGTFYEKMSTSQDYLKMDVLKDFHAYKIWARNSYTGIWIEKDKTFLISRYDASKNAKLFTEYHWDTGSPNGTVKPIALIEKCPLHISENDTRYNNNEENSLLIKYLDKLEVENPVVKGINTLENRKTAAIRYLQLLENRQKTLSSVIPIWKTIKNKNQI